MQLQAPTQNWLLSAHGMQELDNYVIDSLKFPSFALMEMAAKGAFEKINENQLVGEYALIVCGKGNNAGDAIALARYLLLAHFNVHIHFVLGKEGMSEQLQKNWELFQVFAKEQKQSYVVSERDDVPEWSAYDFIVDGIFGIGLSRDISDTLAEQIHAINSCGVKVYALDIPSGLDATTGRILGTAVRADFTISFGFLKTGLYLNAGPKYCGEIGLIELPYPVKKQRSQPLNILSGSWADDVKGLSEIDIPRHKYDNQVVYIVGGSLGLTGAVNYAAKSAWKSGAGAVCIICPKACLNVFENHLPEAIKHPVGNSDTESFDERYTDEIINIIRKRPGTVVVGSGMGRSQSTVDFCRAFVKKCRQQMVIDADALYAIDVDEDFASENVILTPHIGEFALMLGHNLDNDDYIKLTTLQEYCKQHNVNVLLKGSPSIFCDSQTNCCLFNQKEYYFKRAGFGDVLAGRLAFYLERLKNVSTACLLAMYDGEQMAKDYHTNLDKRKDRFETFSPLNMI